MKPYPIIVTILSLALIASLGWNLDQANRQREVHQTWSMDIDVVHQPLPVEQAPQPTEQEKPDPAFDAMLNTLYSRR